MKFKKWLEKIGGHIKLAALIGVAPGRAYHWTFGYITPNAETMLKIAKASKGEVSVEDIIEYTTRNKK